MMLSEEDKNKVGALNAYKSKIAIEGYGERYKDIMACYLNGQLRAGFLLAWFVITESLRDKIFRMADMDVKCAVASRTTISSLEEKYQSTDQSIITEARNCSIITEEEWVTLDHLWKKRCILAHPYNANPSVTDCIYVADKLIEICLNRDIVWNHKLIEDFFKSLKQTPHVIPSNDYWEIQNFVTQKLRLLSNEKEYPFFWKTLMFEIGTMPNDCIVKYRLTLRILANEFLKEKNPDIQGIEYNLQYLVSNQSKACWEVFANPINWELLTDEQQIIMMNYWGDMLENDNVSYVATLMKQAARLHVKINPRCIDIYDQILAQKSVEEVYLCYLNEEKLVDRLESELVYGGDFYRQGRFVDIVKGLMQSEDWNDFSVSQKERLGALLLRCCANNTFVAIEFVNSLQMVSSQELCRGYVQNALDNREINSNYVNKAFEFLAKREQEGDTKLLNYIEKFVSERTEKYTFVMQGELEILRFKNKGVLENSVRLNALFHKAFDNAEYKYE